MFCLHLGKGQGEPKVPRLLPGCGGHGAGSAGKATLALGHFLSGPPTVLP